MLVQKRSRDQPLSHEFSVVLDADYQPFIALVDKRIDVVGRIASAVGDRRPNYVRITRLVPGSVTICWTNSSLMTSLPRSTCPLQVNYRKSNYKKPALTAMQRPTPAMIFCSS